MSSSAGPDRRAPPIGVVMTLGGLAVALIATYLPIWYWSNPWLGSGVVDPSLPASIFEDPSTVGWWGVLGPDTAERFHLVTALLVTWVPVAIVVAAAVIPLVARSLRPSFGPMVAVAVAMWGTQVAIWAAIYRDNNDAWRLEPGGWLLFAGLAVAFVGAIVDRRGTRRSPMSLLA